MPPTPPTATPVIGIVTPDVDEPDLAHFHAAAARADVTLDVADVDDPDLGDRAAGWDAAMAYVLNASHRHAWEAVDPHVPMFPTFEQSLSADKWHCYLTLAAAKVATPDTVLLDDTDGIARLGWPLVTKVPDAWGGVGIRLAHSLDDVADHRAAGATLAQRFLPDAAGQDLRIVVVGGEVVSRIHRVAANPDEFRSNIKLGGQAHQATPDPAAEALAIAATAACGLHVAGVDLLSQDGRWWVCEVNGAPGFTGAPAARMADGWLRPHVERASARRHKRDRRVA